MIDFEHVIKAVRAHNDENVALEDVNLHIRTRASSSLSSAIPARANHVPQADPDARRQAHRGPRPRQRAGPYRHAPAARCRTCAARWASVFQDFRLIPTMTVYENVAFAMRVTNISTKKIKDRVPYVLYLSVWRTRTACRRSSPAANSSVWPWPARWPTAPSSSLRTSPPATSTPK